nr:kelch-like protein 32 [Chelonoidis abingdonii]
MLQRRVYHSMAAVQRRLYVLGGNDLDYNNDRILVRHIDSYNIDTDQWTRCNFNLLTGQNESGVAVHNGRIYLVGGYSIWTNEPLACIQKLQKREKDDCSNACYPFLEGNTATPLKWRVMEVFINDNVSSVCYWKLMFCVIIPNTVQIFILCMCALPYSIIKG